MLLALAALHLTSLPPEQFRHEQLASMQAAFSRFGSQGPEGAIDKANLGDFLHFVVRSMNSAAVPREQIARRSAELTQKLMQQLPAGAERYTLNDLLHGTDAILVYPQLTAENMPEERGNLGSKQLRTLRKQLARNRLTMPLFDTKGWVRDFEKALKIQWEIYANGLSPMHIVVARSDRLYGTETVI